MYATKAVINLNAFDFNLYLLTYMVTIAKAIMPIAAIEIHILSMDSDIHQTTFVKYIKTEYECIPAKYYIISHQK